MNKTAQAAIVSGILDGLCKPLFDAKGKEYTQNSPDVNANFKRQSEDWGMHPLQVWGVFTNKHFASLKTYVQDVAEGKDPETTEPIATRVADMINYLLLLAGLLVDLDLAEGKRLLGIIDTINNGKERADGSH